MMAKVTTKPNGNGHTDPPEEKKSSYVALPRPASRNLTIEQLIEYWKGIDAQFRQRLWGYLYRHFPVIQREPHYIDKLAEPPEGPDSILQTWGTGAYEIRLLDMDLPKGNQICSARFKFKESYAQCPPVLDMVDLDIGHRDNRSYIEWARAKGLLKVPGDQPASNAAETTAVKALADIATKRMEPQESIEGEAATAGFKIMQTATEAAIKTVQAQADPAGLLKLVDAIGGKGGNTELLQLILKVSADAAAQQAGLMKMIVEITTKPQPQVNPLDQLKAIGDIVKQFQPPKTDNPGMGHVREIAETVSVLRDVFGGGRQGKQEWYEAVLGNPDVLDVAKTVAGGFWNWSTAMMNQRGGMQPPPPGTVVPAPGAGDPNPIITPPPKTDNPPNEESMNIAALQQFLLPRFAAFMEALNGGMTGAEFAQELFETRPSLGGMDLGMHAQIKAIGRDKIMSLLAMAPPEVKNLLAGRQSLIITFLDDFLAWEPAKEEDDIPPPGA